MAHPSIATLSGRALVEVAGEDAHAFLDRLLTVDVDDVVARGAGFGALLTPQGKIIADFVITATDGGFLIDLPAPLAADVIKRLTMYRLRARATIREAGADVAVLVVFGGDGAEGPALPGRAVADPRHVGLGLRAYVPAEAAEGLVNAGEAEWQALRTRLGIPEGGTDFAYGDAFPHEAAMDQIAGVDFEKGCYVGQEVVSRMQHRGTARKRPVLLHGAADLPPTGTPVTADGKSAGTLGSVAGTDGLAILRLDRIHGAAALRAGDVAVTASLPGWAGYGWPEVAAAEE